MAFDFKKECKLFYKAANKPEIVELPGVCYLAVEGVGNPNEEDGAYQEAISKLYILAYCLKMSYKTDYHIEGFYEYVVPPLEGFWWQEGVEGIDYDHKEDFHWLSVLRLPDFIEKKDLEWAKAQVLRKKGIDCSKVQMVEIEEGLCVQMMHVGAFDDEPASVALMDGFLEEQGYVNDFSDVRRHHEIYLSDVRKVEVSRWKTIIRHPIKKKA